MTESAVTTGETARALTQRCHDGGHNDCAGYSGGPRYRCTCDCHPDYSREEYAYLIARQAMRRAGAIPATSFRPDDLARELVADLRDGGVLL